MPQFDFSTLPDQQQATGSSVSTQPKYDLSHLPDQPQPEAPGLVERLGGWGGIAGTGVRALSGILSAEGGLPGAAISGVGETLAEKLSGEPYDPKSIATESAFGAVPFGKVVRGAGLVGDVLRSGGLGAAHQAVSNLVHGQDPLSQSTGLAGLLGGIGGGIGSKFVGGSAAAAPVAEDAAKLTVPPGTAEVIPTTQTGPGTSTLGAGKLTATKGIPGEGNVKLTGAKRTVALKPQPITGQGISVPVPPAPQTGGIAPELSELLSRLEPTQPTLPPDLQGKGLPNTLSADEIAAIRADQDAEYSQKMVNAAIPEGATLEPGKVGQTFKSDAGSVKYTWEPPDEEDLPAKEKAPVTRSQQLAGLQAPKVKAIVDQLTGGVAPTPAPAAPDTQSVALAQMFKSPVDAVAAARPMGPFPESGSGLNPLANQQLGVALSSEAQKAGLPTSRGTNLAGFLKSRVSPEIEASIQNDFPRAEPTSGVAPTEASQEPLVLPKQRSYDELNRMMAGESPDDISEMHGGLGIPGLPDIGMSDEMKRRLLSIGGGGALGGAIGAGIDEDDPAVGAAYGALGGGILGHAYGQGAVEAMQKGLGPAEQKQEGLQNLLHWRNAGLLGGWAQAKKPLSDLGTFLTMIPEKLASGQRDIATNLAREMLRLPTNVGNYMSALKNPMLAREATNDLAKTLGIESEGPLGIVARPFGAAQYATQMAMERAGIPREEAMQRLFLGRPETKAFQRYLDLQKSPFFRAIMPFQRIYTNLAEQGLERTPGLNMLMGPEETRLGRGIVGTGAMATGAVQGALDESAQEEDPTDTTSPVIRGLRRAALGPYAIPYMLGEGLTGPTGVRDLFNAIPGLHGAMGAPGPKQTLYDYLKGLTKGQLEQMLPSVAIPWEEK